MSNPLIYLSLSENEVLIEGKPIFYTNDYESLSKTWKSSTNLYGYKIVIPETLYTEDVFNNSDSRKILKVTMNNFYELLSFFILHNKFYFKTKFAGIDINDPYAKLLLNTYIILNKDFLQRQEHKMKSLPVQKSKYNISELINVLSTSNNPEGSIWRFTKKIKLSKIDNKVVGNLIENSQSWINKIIICENLNMAQLFNWVIQISTKTTKLSEIQKQIIKFVKKINKKCKIKSMEEILWALFITNGTKIINDV